MGCVKESLIYFIWRELLPDLVPSWGQGLRCGVLNRWSRILHVSLAPGSESCSLQAEHTHTHTRTNMSQPASSIKSHWPQNMTPSFLAHSCVNAVQTEWAEQNTVSCQTDRPPVTQTSRINKHPGKRILWSSQKDLQTWFKVLVQPNTNMLSWIAHELSHVAPNRMTQMLQKCTQKVDR